LDPRTQNVTSCFLTSKMHLTLKAIFSKLLMSRMYCGCELDSLIARQFIFNGPSVGLFLSPYSCLHKPFVNKTLSFPLDGLGHPLLHWVE